MGTSSIRRWTQNASRLTFMLTIAALLVAGFVLTFYAAVGADPAEPEAPGSIAGTVTDDNGVPVAAANVTLYRDRGDSYPYWVQSANTDATGHYVLGLLAPGIYQVHFMDPTGQLASLFYNGGATSGEAAPVVVAGTNITGIDVQLPPAGFITGTVTATKDLPAYLGPVTLYRRASVNHLGGNGRLVWQRFDETYLTPGENSYRFGGLPGGAYRVCGEAYTVSGFIQECYDDALNVAGATNITVTAGITRGGVNLVLGANAHYSQITGTVTAQNGEALPGISVALLARGDDYWYPTYIYTYTDLSGAYELTRLISGTYTVFFEDPQGNYAFQYYGGSATAAQATPIELGDMAQQRDVNAVLAPAAHITGLVTIVGQPFAPNTFVTAYPLEGYPSSGATTAVVNPRTGSYDIAGLAAQAYRVCAYTYVAGSYYFGCYGGPYLEVATEITLTSGMTRSDVNFDLEGGPTYNGELSGIVIGDGAPQAGIRVNLYTTGCCGGVIECCGPGNPLVYVETDTAGRYTISGLTYGYYLLSFTDPTGLFATSFYSGATSLLTAQPIVLEDTEVRDIATVALDHGGAISGSVHLRTGEPVAQLNVLAYWYSEEGYPFEQYVSRTTTAADGGFTLRGLQAGAYNVCFTYDALQYPEECYGTYQLYGGQMVPVTVQADQVTTGIEQIWGPDLTGYLPLVAN